MGSEQSQPGQKQDKRIPPIRRGHTIATPLRTDSRTEASTSGNDSPGASVCSDSELPYISYTVDRPIGDSPKSSGKGTSSSSHRSSDSRKPALMVQKRQLSLQTRRKKVHDIVVVKEAASNPDINTDEHIKRLQEIPTFLPIMRATLGLPGARDPEVLEGLDYRPWARLASRYQAHLAACAQPIAADQAALSTRVKEIDSEIIRLHASMVERQRQNARNAERLSRVKEMAHQVSRCGTLLKQTLSDIDELNNILPPAQRLDAPDWLKT